MSERYRFELAEALTFLQSLPDASVDALICDPPYSSGGATRGDRSIGTTLKYKQTGVKVERPDFIGDNRDQRAYLAWCTVWLSECLRVLVPGAPVCLFTDWRQLPTTTDALQCGGFVWRGLFVWDKGPAARPSMGRFSSRCEYVVWGSNGPMPEREGVGCLQGLYTCHQTDDDKHHLVGKPTAIMKHIVCICPPGGIVLDPFAGSATTGIACLLQGRRFVGCELSPEYHAIGLERLEAAASGVSLEAHRAGQAPLFPSP